MQLLYPDMYFFSFFQELLSFKSYRAHTKYAYYAPYSLAYCEMYLALANVLRRFEFELFKTGLEDVEVVSNALVGHPRKESKGVRVKIRKVVGS